LSTVLVIGFLVSPIQVFADTMGNTSTAGMSTAGNGSNQIELARFKATSTGTLNSITVFVPSPSGNGIAGIYSDNSGSPGTLIVQGSQQALSAQVAFTISGSVTITQGTNYWLAVETQSSSYYYSNNGPTVRGWASGTCCTLPNTLQIGSASGSYAIYATYTTGPPPPPPSDFTISGPTAPVVVSAGGTATFPLVITYSSTLSTTVNLGAPSGCPSGVTCTLSQTSVSGSTTVTLTVPTLITTPNGTTTISVTATSSSPSLSHTVQVQLTVNSPGSYAVSVHSGATQVVVTVTWSGSGAASVTLAGPGGSPTLSESGQTVYDRTTYGSGSTTPTNIHRVTFNISANSPTSPQTWTVLVSLSGSYTITIEVA
jgi:hypothetical protein